MLILQNVKQTCHYVLYVIHLRKIQTYGREIFIPCKTKNMGLGDSYSFGSVGLN